MVYLRNIKIQTRLIFLVLLPLLVILGTSYQNIQESQKKIVSIQKLDTALEYANIAYPFITSALKESYYTRIFLDSSDLDASHARTKMLQARDKTLKAQNNFVRFLNINKTELSQYPTLYQEIELFLPLLENTKYLRKVADQKSHFSKEFTQEYGYDIHTMYFFNLTISKVVNSMNQLAYVASKNEKLFHIANAYSNLIQMNMEATFHNSMLNLAKDKTLDIYVFGEIMSAYQKYESARARYYSFATETSKAILNSFDTSENQKQWGDVALKARSNVYDIQNKPLEIGENTDWEQINQQQFSQFKQAIAQVVDELISTKDQLLHSAELKTYKTLTFNIIVLVILTILCFIVAKSITSPLSNLVKTFYHIAQNKNLATSINSDGKDELSELSFAFSDLLKQLRTTLLNVQQEAQHIHSTSDKMVLDMDKSVNMSNHQFKSTEDISVAINEMSSTIAEVANMAAKSSESVDRAHHSSVTSYDKSQLSQNIMTQLTTELGSTQKQMTQLANECDAISNVATIIEGIAEQTNLLALNAAIEAARAGEQGRGFAVVADEVRNLASRTQESTETIRTQIEKLQVESQSVTEKMGTLQNENDQAVEIVLANSKALEGIKEDLNQIMSQSIHIATATEEQSSVSEEVSERITSLASDSREIQGKTQNSMTSTDQLKIAADTLFEDISKFTL